MREIPPREHMLLLFHLLCSTDENGSYSLFAESASFLLPLSVEYTAFCPWSLLSHDVWA